MNIFTWLEGADVAVEDPPAQRRKHQHSIDDTFTHAFNALPQTPPFTTMSPASGLGMKKKRGTGDRLDYDVDSVDDATTSNSRSSSPKRRSRSNSPTKNPTAKNSWGNLEILEKPVLLQDITEGATNLPNDVRILYDQICLASDKEHVIPFEVRDQMVATIGGRAARNFLYREKATAEAEGRHGSLRNIFHEAKAAEKLEYHETGWNHAVHTPLLKLVYPSTEPEEGFTLPPQAPSPSFRSDRSGNARVVYTMSATISPEYAPRKRMVPPTFLMRPLPVSIASATPSVPPLSIPQSYTHAAIGSPGSASGSVLSTNARSEIEVGGVTYNRSDSKKVDYALVVDIKDNAPLRGVLDYIWNEGVCRNVLPHINQSLYRPLRLSPIACSIETKRELNLANPLVQLGTWVAAWHKRMGILREYLLDTVDDLRSQRSTEDARIPTTLLVKVVNHDWTIYFVCDRGNHIDVCGPQKIGSTSNMMDIYVLLTSLEAIKDWIETTFREGLETWFMCENLGR
ncbi:hypothetical protein F5Y18DRAFT_254190 [Xylariaceae sp. FL1019]|nr:hypothetical protein F5Y18DRAFT_254190 [Xylariaceae sp. FL1019]